MSLKKKCLSTLLTASILASSVPAVASTVQAADSGNSVSAQAEASAVSSGSQKPLDSIQGGNILHCFVWSYNTIKENLADIKAAGYTAVQTSPVLPPKDYNSAWTRTDEQWWKLYQPIDIAVADKRESWLGTKAELAELCDEAEKYGIKVITDIVVNHMANNGEKGNKMEYIGDSVNPVLKSNPDYWHINDDFVSDTNRWYITQGCLGQPDLNTGNPYIQQCYKNLLCELVSLGVDGFRFDAAKHVELPTDTASGCASDFWPVVINGTKESTDKELYFYGEILGYAGTAISNYTKYMDVTDDATGNSALSATINKNASSLANSSYYKGSAPSESVLWAESHDTYISDATSNVSDSDIVKTWAIVGSRAESTSLFLARPSDYMGKASTNTTWKSKAVSEINKFKNYFDGKSEYLASSGSCAYIERGTEGVIISKLNGAGAVSLTANKIANGIYKDQISGNVFTVANGKINGTVGDTGVAVVYNAAVSPLAMISPSSQSYKTDTLTLKLTYKDATSGEYSINNGEYIKFTNGDTITIGEGVNYGEITTVAIRASDSTETSAPVVYSYKKVNPAEKQMVYFDNKAYKWSSVYAYIYDDSVSPAVSNASWPGITMTYNSSLGLYETEIPETLSKGKVIFTEDKNATTNRYPADFQPGLELNDSSMIFEANHSWKEYTASPEQPTTQKPTEAPTTQQSTTASVTACVGDADLDGTITISDVTAIQLYLAKISKFSNTQKLVSDVDGNGTIGIRDATAIMHYLVDNPPEKYYNCGQSTGIAIE